MKIVFQSCDVLVIGGGIAGLRAACAAAEAARSVCVVAKGPRCSPGLVGLNAAVAENDSVNLFEKDIYFSGRMVADGSLGHLLAEHAHGQVEYLEKLGLKFDRNADECYNLHCPLGCSVPRLVHSGASTGSEAERLMLEKLNNSGHTVRSDFTVLDLLSDGTRVYGAIGWGQGEKNLTAYISGAVIMAAGGCGDIYSLTTYPAGIQGDAYAMAYRAGAELVDMEFNQFEPCCLTKPAALRGTGVSTTLLNAGAKLLNATGENMIEKYFSDGETVQKSTLARAIASEVHAGKGVDGGVLFDLTALPEEDLQAHIWFYDSLVKAGIDAKNAPLTVAPSAHTFLGGLRVNESCASNLENLYAAGEALGGLHGANRIGGCAGTEVFVFGARAGESAAVCAEIDPKRGRMLAEEKAAAYEALATDSRLDYKELKEQTRDICDRYLGLIRNGKELIEAERQLMALQKKCGSWEKPLESLVQAVEVQNMITTALLMVKASQQRCESRGVYFRNDHPQEKDRYVCSFVLKQQNNEMLIERIER